MELTSSWCETACTSALARVQTSAPPYFEQHGVTLGAWQVQSRVVGAELRTAMCGAGSISDLDDLVMHHTSASAAASPVADHAVAARYDSGSMDGMFETHTSQLIQQPLEGGRWNSAEQLRAQDGAQCDAAVSASELCAQSCAQRCVRQGACPTKMVGFCITHRLPQQPVEGGGWNSANQLCAQSDAAVNASGLCAHVGSHLCAWHSAEQRSAQCDGAEQRNTAEQRCAQDGARFDAAISASGMCAHGGSQLDAAAGLCAQSGACCNSNADCHGWAEMWALGMALSSAQHSATALSSFCACAHVGCERMAAHSMTPICSPHLSNSAGQRSVQCDAHFECPVSVPAQWRSGASRATLRKWHFTPWRRRAQGGKDALSDVWRREHVRSSCSDYASHSSGFCSSSWMRDAGTERRAALRAGRFTL